MGEFLWYESVLIGPNNILSVNGPYIDFSCWNTAVFGYREFLMNIFFDIFYDALIFGLSK